MAIANEKRQEQTSPHVLNEQLFMTPKKKKECLE